MTNRVIVCRTAWMDFYRGVTEDDRPVGGGSHIAETGSGGEVHNFEETDDGYFGYFQPRGEGVNLRRLGAPDDADLIDGVTVIWIATHPQQGGQRIVGWYRNATVYSTIRYLTSPSRRTKDPGRPYLMSSKDAVLLDLDARLYSVPKASGGAPGTGQSQIWYPPAGLEAEYQTFVDNNGRIAKARPKKDRKRASRLQDTEKRLRIERTAMETTARWFEERGYSVSDVSGQRVGWDLEARHEKTLLRIEVKGTSLPAESASVELTPNEYKNMRDSGRDRGSFRLCVVCDAEHTPNLFIFAWSEKEGRWLAGDGRLSLEAEEIVGARMKLGGCRE